jgi:RHS repeat-associated protein
MVNRQNANVYFAIPIVSSPGRGMNFDFSLIYNSSFWGNSGSAWLPGADSNGYPAWGWSTTKFAGGSVSHQSAQSQCRYWDTIGTPHWAYQYTTQYYNFVYTDGSGAVHNFDIDYFSSATNCDYSPVGPYSATAEDGSGISYNPVGNALIFPDGTGLIGTSFADPNGNKISPSTTGSETDWTDTVGRIALKIIVNSSDTQYEYLDPTGAYQITDVKYQSYNIQTNFGCSGVSEWANTVSLPYEIDLPNGNKFTMTYEDTPGFSGYTTGRLKRITLPTGGYYQYDYTGSNDGTNCADGTALGMTRTYSDGSTSSQWTYARSSVSGLSGTTTITAPQLPYDSTGNQSAFVFNFLGQETQGKYYQGAATGTPLREIDKTWASNGSPATSITTLETGQQSEVDTIYDDFHNLTLVKEYDLGPTAPGALLRETDMYYANPGGYRLTQKFEKDGSANIIYREDRAYDETTPTCVSGVTQHDDTHFGCSYHSRGNLTTLTTYTAPAAPSGGVAKTFTYNTLGNLLTASVGGTLQTQSTYSSTTVYSAPDYIVVGPSGGPQLTTTYTYNSYTGQIASTTDPNSQTSSYSYDVYKRLTTGTRPDSTQLTTSYDDTNFTVTSTTPIDSTHSQKSIVAYDGLARPVSGTLEDASSSVYSITQTQYDPIGRGYKTSNPYTSSPSYWTETRFDALGRVLKTILPDSSYSTAAYSGNCSTATDPTGKSRKSCSDGLSRTTAVYEDPSTLNYETDYTYNLLGALTGVSQGSQTRSYTYDGMGRLTGAATPEAGTVSSTYNGFNLVTSTTDARGVVTNYSYDSLNRITGLSYNVGTTGVTATSSVSYTYGTSSSSNNNGRLITMSDGTGSESYSYDILGRVTELDKVVGSTTYSTEYAYNLASEMTQITYPSSRVVKQTFDALGRLCGVGASGSTCSSGTTYASGYNYNSAGEVTGFNYGNGVVANLSYSPDRLQLHCLQYDTTSVSDPCTKDSSALFMLTYGYGSSGANNGAISGITDGMDSGRSSSYSYDSLGRLSSGSTTGSSAYPAWGLSWTYDRYGNRTAQSIASGCSGITCPTNSLTVSTTTNRVTGTGYSYDSAGNMTNDGYNAMTYDAASRLIAATNTSSSGAYAYDGKGMRVEKCIPNCSSPTTTTLYIFSGAKVLAEYDNGAAVGSPSRENIYSGGSQIAKIAGSTTTYYHQDHLSNRLVTNSSGGVVEQTGHLPFGESWYDTGSEKWVFTTYERDAESGNDYAQARYDVNRLGRFGSPDPLSGSTANPQSLNHYAYAGNDPVNSTDPTGLSSCDPSEYTLQSPMPPVCTESIMDTGQAPNAIGFGGCIECEFDSDFLEAHQEYLAYQDLQSYVLDQATHFFNMGYKVTVNGIPFINQTSPIYQAFLAIAKNLGFDPNLLVSVGFRDIRLVYSVWLDSCPVGDCKLNRDNLDGYWKDPLNSFHGGNDSWYSGYFLDTPHIVDGLTISAHVDPFGPLNPLHYIIQIGIGYLLPPGPPGVATCSIVGGCTIR